MPNLNNFIEITDLKNFKEVMIDVKFAEDDYRIAYNIGLLKNDYFNGVEFLSKLRGINYEI